MLQRRVYANQSLGAAQSTELDISTKIQVALDLLKRGKPSQTSNWYNRTVYYARIILALSYVAGVLAYLKLDNSSVQCDIEKLQTQLQELKINYDNRDFYKTNGWWHCKWDYPLHCNNNISTYPIYHCRDIAQQYCHTFNLLNMLHNLHNLQIYLPVSIAPALFVIYDSYRHLQQDNKLHRYDLTGAELDKIKSLASEVKLTITNDSSGDAVAAELQQRQALLLGKSVENKSWMYRLFGSCCGRKKVKEDEELMLMDMNLNILTPKSI